MSERALEIRPLESPPDTKIQVPGSKSLTNRALILAASADGPSTLRGCLDADDTRAMVDVLSVLGAQISPNWNRGLIEVAPGESGVDGGPDEPLCLDARLSGTTARFVLPLACLSQRHIVLDGLAPLRRRPIGQLIASLRKLGASITELGQPGCLPLAIGVSNVDGGAVEVAGDMSSQFLSALLLAGPLFPAGLDVRVTGTLVARPFVDLTVDVLEHFGAVVEHRTSDRFVTPHGALRGVDYQVEPDATSASYFSAAAAITGGVITLDGLGTESKQGDVAFFEVLESMGAKVTRFAHSTVIQGADLQGVDVDLSAIPDTALTLAAVAVFADGPTRIRGVDYIRGHETDRVAAVVTELRRLGIDANEESDGFTVKPGAPQPGRVRTYDDHRMAMSFALIGLRSPGITILDPQVVEKTYPRYFEDLDSLRSKSSPAER